MPHGAQAGKRAYRRNSADRGIELAYTHPEGFYAVCTAAHDYVNELLHVCSGTAPRQSIFSRSSNSPGRSGSRRSQSRLRKVAYLERRSRPAEWRRKEAAGFREELAKRKI